jgi:hypothetical protein
MAGILSEVNDYSPFVKTVLRIKIDEMVEYLKDRYDTLYYPRVESSVGKDSLRFSIRKDLNDVFGLGYHKPDAAHDIQHHFVLWTEFEFGKGKKNEGKNNFTVHTDVSVPTPPERYSTEQNPYYVLHSKVGEGRIVDFKQGFSTDEFIADPIKFAKQIESAIDTTIQRTKDAWIELHDEQTSRDIDLMEVPGIIKSAFEKHSIPVRCELNNNLTNAMIVVETEFMEDHVGYMELHYMTDKGEWEFELSRGEFDFIGHLFDLTNSKYDRNKKAIKNDKIGELMEFIAEQYLAQVKTKLDFEAKLDYYMDCWVKND